MRLQIGALWKTVRHYLEKLRIQIYCDPAVPLTIYIYHRETHTYVPGYVYTNAHINIIFNNQKLKLPTASIHRMDLG